MLDRLDESSEIELSAVEAPIMAVDAIWQQHDDEGPEGILFLTDQRLLFEQREEVVTKKRFGIFKAESEIIQQLLLTVVANHVTRVEHRETGGVLGIGKDDILELHFSHEANIGQSQFHLKGQDSADWASLINRVRNGAIDEDRADDYEDELDEAEALAARFPDKCPTCSAAVPPPPLGATSVTCSFCGSTIAPDR